MSEAFSAIMITAALVLPDTAVDQAGRALPDAGALIASSAYAADEIQIGDSSPLLHQARLVCNDAGQCWHTRGDRRVIIGDSYYGPRRYYGDRDYYREPGVGIRGPGFSFGVGPGYW